MKEKGRTSLQNRHEITEKERGDDWHREQNQKLIPQKQRERIKKFYSNTNIEINYNACVKDTIFHHQFSKLDQHNAKDVGRDLSSIL